MTRTRSTLTHAGLVSLIIAAPASVAHGQWPQWGGPNRDFTVDASGLADQWPGGDGPKKLWRRTLGDGYSAIVYDDGMLYTMYRRARMAKVEYTIALDAQSGTTVWEHKNRAPYVEQPDERWGGHGPNATPLVAGSRLYTIGSRAVLHAFDKKTGAVLWEHDLVSEFGAGVGRHVGYCFSPIAHGDSIIVAADRQRPELTPDQFEREVPKIEARGAIDGHTLMAFDQGTGKLLWKGLDIPMGYSSPLMIDFGGASQLVLSTNGGLIGVNPDNGHLLWQHARRGNDVTPVWNGKDMLFYSSASGDARGRGVGVKLTKRNGKTVPEEVYFNKKIKFGQPTPVRLGNHLYGCDEQSLLAIAFDTGQRMWLKRGFPSASCLYADGKLIILDQDGNLTLATATPNGLTVHAQCEITERYSFSVPTLVGTVLYIRDCEHISALDLGKPN